MSGYLQRAFHAPLVQAAILSRDQPARQGLMDGRLIYLHTLGQQRSTITQVAFCHHQHIGANEAMESLEEILVEMKLHSEPVQSGEIAFGTLREDPEHARLARVACRIDDRLHDRGGILIRRPKMHLVSEVLASA